MQIYNVFALLCFLMASCVSAGVIRFPYRRDAQHYTNTTSMATQTSITIRPQMDSVLTLSFNLPTYSPVDTQPTESSVASTTTSEVFQEGGTLVTTAQQTSITSSYSTSSSSSVYAVNPAKSSAGSESQAAAYSVPVSYITVTKTIQLPAATSAAEVSTSETSKVPATTESPATTKAYTTTTSTSSTTSTSQTQETTLKSASSASSPVSSSTASSGNAAVSGNAQLAINTNIRFAALTNSSSCDASDPTQLSACIGGNFVQCDNGNYSVAVACANPLKCFALPLESSTGVSVACTTVDDAAFRMGFASTDALDKALAGGTVDSGAGSSSAVASTTLSTSTILSTPTTLSTLSTPTTPTTFSTSTASSTSSTPTTSSTSTSKSSTSTQSSSSQNIYTTFSTQLSTPTTTSTSTSQSSSSQFIPYSSSPTPTTTQATGNIPGAPVVTPFPTGATQEVKTIVITSIATVTVKQ